MEDFIMGFKELVKKQVDAYTEKKELSAQRQQEYNEQTHLMMNFTCSTQKIQCGANCMMHQKPDGTVLFGYNTVNTYRLVSYEWSGPQYNTITKSNTSGTEIKKGKAGKIGAGAVIGGLAGPAGMAIGAAMGAGSKGQKNIQSNTTSVSQQIEIPTPATIKLKNTSTGEVFGLTFNCTTQLDAKIRAFNFDSEPYVTSTPEPTPASLPEWHAPQDSVGPQNSQPSTDPYEEIKKLKELLDMDVITQEEFDSKKKQLLNI